MFSKQTYKCSTGQWGQEMCLTSLNIREMQITVIKTYYLTPARMNIIKMTRDNKCRQVYGRKRTLCTIGGNLNWHNYLWKTLWKFFKK